MEITCPNCGQTCEVDEEPAIGQHLLCLFCDVKFNYTQQNTTENDSNTAANAAETNEEEPFEQIQTSCSHCGAVYEVDAAYIGETATCGTCDKAFVVKAKHGHTAAVSGKKSPKTLLAKVKSEAAERERKRIADSKKMDEQTVRKAQEEFAKRCKGSGDAVQVAYKGIEYSK